jgi:hypothetical protein
VALNDILAYFRTYDQSIFNVVACQGNEPSEDDIAAFERECGIALPAEFRQFTMSPLGGLYMEVVEELWPRAEVYAVGPFWSFQYGIKVFGIATDIPDWLDLLVQFREMRDAGFPKLVPFLQLVCDANRYCFNAAGQIVYWDHEEPEKLSVVPSSFSDLLMTEIRDLEDRARRKIAGEDKQT